MRDQSKRIGTSVAQPASDKSRLYETLKVQQHAGVPFDEVTARRLHRDISKLPDPVEQFEHLGMLYGIQLDHGKYSYYFEKALDFDYNARILWNYFVALTKSSRIVEAYDIGLKAALEFYDATIIEEMLVLTITFLDIEMFEALMSRLENIGAEKANFDEATVLCASEAKLLKRFIDAGYTTAEKLKSAGRIVAEIVDSFGVSTLVNRIEHYPENEHLSIIYRILDDFSVDTLIDMNFVLAERLVGADLDVEHFVIQFCKSNGEELNGCNREEGYGS